MTELRWILLIAGIALIVALYLLGSRNRKHGPLEFERSTRMDPPRPASVAEPPRLEPRMSLEEEDAELDGDEPDEEPVVAHAPPTPPAVAPTMRREPSLGARAEPALRTEVPLRAELPIRPELPLRAEPFPRQGAARDESTAFAAKEDADPVL